MAIEWDIYLGTSIPTAKLSSFGRTTTINIKETTRDQRAADGTLKQDILYTKKQFVLNYTAITESALDVFDTWYSTYQTNKTPIKLYRYTSTTVYDEYDVIPRPVDRTQLIKAADNLYTGVQFVLDEA